MSEVEFFHEIFEDFLRLDKKFYEDELWKYNSIIKLMHVSDDFENKALIEEGLKVIIDLCKFKECGDLRDFYDVESYSVDELAELEKTLLKSILKAEFI